MALYASIGYLGVMLIGAFFVLGTLASLFRLTRKRQWGISEGKSVTRGWQNVVANSGICAVIALLDLVFPQLIANESLLIAAGFASALSDTLSSEMGNVTSHRYYHILSWKSAPRGQDGVVSGEGTAWGVVGSLTIALIYTVWFGFNQGGLIVFLAGIVGNLLDSILGATLQQRDVLNNHGVNLVSTTGAVLLASLLSFFTDLTFLQ